MDSSLMESLKLATMFYEASQLWTWWSGQLQPPRHPLPLSARIIAYLISNSR